MTVRSPGAPTAQTVWMLVICNLIFRSLVFFSVEKNKTELFFSHCLYGQFQPGVNFYSLIMKLCEFQP